ncbi:MAG: hypothetical protein ABSG03_33265 [Bryobacteraceae bacterium]
MGSISQSRSAISHSPPFSSLRLSRIRLAHLGILAVLPLVLALLNDYWAFTSSQSPMIDPWLYTSYFLHLKAQLLAFPGAYYGDRLSYNVPGWLVYHTLGPWVGNYVIKLFTIYTAIFALYYAVLTLFDESTALISCALISVQPYFLMAFGWDYVDGIGIAYYSLSLLFVLRATTSYKWRILLFTAGIFTTCLVTTQLLWMNIAWTVPLLYFVTNSLYSKHRFWESLSIFLAGSAAAFAVWSCVYYFLTGHWFYIANSVRHTLHGFGAAQKVATPIGGWIGEAHWLAPYSALIPAALWLLCRRQATSRQRICLALFAVSYLTIWVWELVGFPFTKLFFYSDYIFPVYVLALAALLNDWAKALRQSASIAIAGFVVATGGTMLFSMPLFDRLQQILITCISQHPSLSTLWGYQALWVAAIGAAAGVFLCIPRFRRTLPAAFIGGTLFMCSLQLTLQWRQGWFSKSPGSDYTNKEGFRLILDADAWTNHVRSDRRMLVWYDQTEPRLGIISGLSSLYLWGWSLLNFHLPNLEPKDGDRIQALGDILIVSWNDDAISRAHASLKAIGWDVAGEQDTTIRNGHLALHLGFFDVISTTVNSSAVIQAEGLKEVSGILKLSAILPTTTETSLQSNNEALHITTPAQQWAYAAYTPLPFASTDRDRVWIRLSARVLRGQVGFGVLNGSEKEFYIRKTLGQSSSYSIQMLEVDHPEDARKLVIENDTEGGKKADVLISGISLLARPDSLIWKRLTTEPLRVEAQRDVVSTTDSSQAVIEPKGLEEVSGILKLSAVLPTTKETSLQNKEGLHITTPAQQWAYAAYTPLPFASTDRDRVWIRVSAKVLSGQIGFGVLNGSEKAFYTRKTLAPGSGYSIQMLEVDHPEDARKLIIENDTPGGKKADVLISGISLLARPDSVIWKRLTSKSPHAQGQREEPE